MQDFSLDWPLPALCRKDQRNTIATAHTFAVNIVCGTLNPEKVTAFLEFYEICMLRKFKYSMHDGNDPFSGQNQKRILSLKVRLLF